MTPADLPAVNAALNAASAGLLSAGYACIRLGHRRAHRNLMLGAVATSTLFLIGYLTYHFNVRTVTHFREPAGFRPLYLLILATHTVLAAAVVPLVLVTVWRGLRERFDAHRRLARWTWPVWLYVSVTGVLIYLLLYRIFPQH